MKLHESGEMYLETILVLSRKNPYVRAIDVGEYMGFSKPSVSRALSLLKSGGFVEVGETGREVAEKIYERHCCLSEVLIQMGVDRETADTDACKIEHVISDESFNAIKKHFSFE